MDKWLVDFPRPANDTGRGVHWSPSQYKWGREQWGFWRSLLADMNIKWVKVLDDGSGSSMGLIKRLIDLGIMPVVRIYKQEPNPGIINAGELNFMRECVKLGVFYFETNNEPDLDLEWKNRDRPENWLDIVVGNFITEASYIRDFGGYLLFPAFGPGGRGNPFQMIVDRGHGDLLDGNMCLAIHNYCLARPLTYPNDPVNMAGEQLTREQWESAGGIMGPMWAWEMGINLVNEERVSSANPNADIMTDSTCFRAYEYFDQLVNDACGHSIPIFTTEGGYNVGQRAGTTFGDDPRYPKLTPEETSQANLDMFKSIENGPDYYFACMPWIIGVAAFGHGAINFETQGPWITNLFDFDWGLSGELPIVQMLKDYPGKPKVDSVAPEEWARYNNPLYDERKFDRRLQYLEPEITFDVIDDNETDWHFRLEEAMWQDENASGNIFIRIIDEFSRIIEGHPAYVMHGDQVVTVITKGPIDNGFGDIPMTGGLGSYSVSVPGISDAIHGLGLGNENGHWKRTSFFLTFRKVRGVIPNEPEEPSEPEEPDTPGDCEEVESELRRVQQELAELKSRVAGLCEDAGE